MGVKALSNNSWVSFFVALVKAKQFRSLGRRVLRKAGKTAPDGFEISAPRVLQRNVWMFWDKGLDQAPEIVKMCIKSWHDKNPGWTIRVLDKDTVSDYVTMPELSSEMSIQSYSNLLRFRLLKEQGGVWTDATAYCVKPLDEWLPMVAQRGFFAFFWTPETRWFTWPGYTREVATWFLAAEAGNTVMSEWEEYSFRYWEGRQKPHLYFWCQTLFELLIYMRSPFRRALSSVPKFGAHAPHIVHDCIMRNRDVARVGEILDAGAAPVQKLRWQWDEDKLDLVKALLHEDGSAESADNTSKAS